ncbi:MAG: peptidoglycan-binding domain-containing protein [bacterium]|nr:peptidoglycan-binding domain-containing protein [bacterium]
MFQKFALLLVPIGCAVVIMSAVFLAPKAFALVGLSGTAGPGAQGSNVTNLQLFLATDATVYPEGTISGFYGPLTQAAVQRFQCKRGIICSGSVSATGYGRVGPATLAVINASIAAGGGGGTVGDVHAPIMTAGTFATTSNSVVFSWSTNEPARSRIMYGLSFPFLYATAPSFVDASVDANTNVVLSSLVSKSPYFYVRESVDVNGNVQWDIPRTFISP